MAIFLLPVTLTLLYFQKGGFVLAKHMINVFYVFSIFIPIYNFTINGFATAILKLIIACFVVFTDKSHVCKRSLIKTVISNNI